MNTSAMAALHALSFTIPRPWKASEFQSLMATPGVFVCAENDALAIGRLVGPEVELLTLAVHPDARRQGKGGKILREFEAHARKNDAEQAFLEVAEDNLAAIALYFNSGYTMAGHRKNYYSHPGGDKITALVMKRTLLPG